MKHHFTTTTTATIKIDNTIQIDNTCGNNVGNKLCVLLVGMWIDTATLENNKATPQNIKNRTKVQSMYNYMSWFFIYIKSRKWRDICKPMFIAALFIELKLSYGTEASIDRRMIICIQAQWDIIQPKKALNIASQQHQWTLPWEY